MITRTSPFSVSPLLNRSASLARHPTTISTLNATQQQYLLDSMTVCFSERVLEGGIAGVPSFYLQVMESNPALLGLNRTSSYRDFFAKLAADMQAKWPLKKAPNLDA